MKARPLPILPKLLRAIYWFDEALRATQVRMGQTPVTRAQAMLLINVALGERRPVRLARALGVTKQAVSLMLADLAAAGAIVMQPDPDDARASLVAFSPAGMSDLEVIFAALAEMETHLATVIGEDRMTVLRAILDMEWGSAPALTAPDTAKAPRAPESPAHTTAPRASRRKARR
ncbi:MarR family winged helix-turn-helix transcriptional regulator [Ancylobacter sp. IITR112]|uniref:MarR family winged helix-turn-helix transcriptional regulator n=1 Tax=Ancylobacter sp. IITR112 TaxID=3138073 RepID=UPI00352BB68B